jgi:hypothetical protein
MAVDYSAAALAAARRYCGWVVTPPETVTITVDGPGGRDLSLPTLHLSALTAVVEDGVTLNVAELAVSVNTGIVRKRFGCWTSKLGGIQVTMTHGYAAAPDFDAAVAQIATTLSAFAARDDPALIGKKVDDVEYQWSVTLLNGSGINESLLSAYRILPAP